MMPEKISVWQFWLGVCSTVVTVIVTATLAYANIRSEVSHIASQQADTMKALDTQRALADDRYRETLLLRDALTELKTDVKWIRGRLEKQ